MTEKASGEPHSAGHISGNVDAVEGEIRRLHDLKEQLWSTGETLRKINIDAWAGSARDSFEEFRHNLARQWLITGDLHEDAARALARYHETLSELQSRVATADPNATGPAAAADQARWSRQLNSEAGATAAAVRRAAHALACLPRLLDQSAPPSVAVALPTRTNTAAPQAHMTHRASHNRTDLDPRAARSDPARFQQCVQALCHAILVADYITMAQFER